MSMQRAFLIFLIALVTRAVFLVHLYSKGGEPMKFGPFVFTEPGLYTPCLPAYFFSPDAQSYDTLATNLLKGEGLWMEDYRGLYGERGVPVRSFRPVMMPLYLAGVYSVLGHSFLPARVGLLILSSLSCVFVYVLGRRLVGETGSWFAGLGTAVYPRLIYYSPMLSTETLYIFLLLLVTVLLYRSAERMGWWNWVVTGVVFSMAVLTRSVLGAFLPVLVLWFIVYQDSRKAGFRNYVVMCMGAVVGLSPWVVRNYIVHGEFVPLTTEGGFTLWVTNNEKFKGGGTNYLPEDKTPLLGKTETQIDRTLYRMGLEYIRKNPGIFLKNAIRKFVDFWRPYPRPSQVGWKPALVSALSFLPVLVLAIWGMIAYRWKWREHWLVYLLIIYYTCIHMVFMSVTRYRLPLEPYLIIFAGGALGSLLGYDEE